MNNNIIAMTIFAFMLTCHIGTTLVRKARQHGHTIQFETSNGYTKAWPTGGIPTPEVTGPN